MNKLLTTLSSLLFIAHCSFGGQSGFWNETKKIKKEKEIKIKELFKKEEPHEKEMNTNLKINLKDSVSPVLIEDVSDKNSFYVIMPMNI